MVMVGMPARAGIGRAAGSMGVVMVVVVMMR